MLSGITRGRGLCIFGFQKGDAYLTGNLMQGWACCEVIFNDCYGEGSSKC